MKKYIDYINKNKKVIEKTLEIDNKKWEENIRFEDLIKEEKIEVEFEKEKTYLVIYEGQPEITKQLIEKAIDTKTNLILTIRDYYLATNTAFVSIANKYIEENNIIMLFKLYNNISDDKIYEATAKADKTVYIGDLRDFNYIKNNIQNEAIFIEYND